MVVSSLLVLEEAPFGGDSLSLLETCKGLASANVRNGHSTLLWLDVWDSHFLSIQWPELYSFVRNKNIAIFQAAHSSSVQDLFHLPLSEEAFEQYQDFNVLVAGLQLQEDSDIWSYIWGSLVFTPRKAYAHLIGDRPVDRAFKWLWKSCCQNKRKIFFCLLLKNRLNTRSLLRRKNMALEDYNCVLCSHQTEETLEHLFLICPFAEACWATLGIYIPQHDDIFAVLDNVKVMLNMSFYMEIIITMAWVNMGS
jgi:hypothetical protein